MKIIIECYAEDKDALLDVLEESECDLRILNEFSVEVVEQEYDSDDRWRNCDAGNHWRRH